MNNLRGRLRSWTYASTLAYLADANIGRSSSAFATNSAARGISAFIAVEVVVPLQVNMNSMQMVKLIALDPLSNIPGRCWRWCEIYFSLVDFFDDDSCLTRMDIHNLGRVDANDCLPAPSCQLAWRAMAHASGGSGGGCCRSPGKGVIEDELRLLCGTCMRLPTN